MPDNSQDTPPEGLSAAEVDATIATLDAEDDSKGQAGSGAGAEAAEPLKKDEADKGKENPPAKSAHERLGFKSEDDLGKSYEEHRTLERRRDDQIAAGKKAQETLDRFKKNVFGDRKEGDGAGKPAPSPAAAEEKGDLEELYPEVAARLKLQEKELLSLKEGLASDRQQAETYQREMLEKHQRKVIIGLIEEVGLDAYEKVMNNPDWESFIAEHIVAGDDPKYVYGYVNEKMNEARGQKMSGTDDSTGGTGGGALPPGGKPGGEKTPPPETYKDRVIREMNEEVDKKSGDFWAKGKEK